MKCTFALLEHTPFSYLISCLLILFLTACSNNNMSDLEQYVHEERAKPAKNIDPLPEAQSYTIYTYNETGMRNPFVDENISVANSTEECQKVTRSKTALETVPIDSLTLVGSLEQQGERWALVKDKESNVHRLKKGEYMGQNNGRILQITDSEVVLQELVSDRMEGCQTRKTTLAIAES